MKRSDFKPKFRQITLEDGTVIKMRLQQVRDAVAVSTMTDIEAGVHTLVNNLYDENDKPFFTKEEALQIPLETTTELLAKFNEVAKAEHPT